MSVDKMEENKPPSVKLKQAKLSFSKTTSDKIAPVKINPLGQGRKRRNSDSNSSCPNSPSKSSKLGKPLVALDNSETPTAKATKIRKISFGKGDDGNDHEVSSSSEAESGSSKSTSGNFLERFVCKIPCDGHQEISSTNEILDVSHVDPTDDLTEVEQNQRTKETVQDIQKDATSEPDCIVIDDVEACVEDKEETPSESLSHEQMEEMCNSSENTGCEPLAKVRKNKSKESGMGIAKCKKKSGKSSSKTESAEKTDIKAEEHEKESKDESSNICSQDVNKACTENDTSIVSEEDLDESVRDSSFMSVEGSTPAKKNEVVGSDAEDTAATPKSQKNSKTTASSGKRGRKVDSAKKAEREASKAEKEAQKLKLREDKDKERQERKRKLEEEKAEKERIKKEKKEAKERERQEQKEKLEKQKQEKERAKEEERLKKEEERLRKEEEKKKKQAALDAKQEEKRKKDEEKKQKEEEKLREEEEKKKKEEKAKEAFQRFFIKPIDTSVKPVTPKANSGMFIPFEVKKDMHLAPTVRRDALSEEKKHNVDQILANSQGCLKTYIEQLKIGEVEPHKTGKVLRTNPRPPEDVEIVHDSEALKTVLHKVKLLQFHTDYRPPYYGTWRKTPSLSPRNPWKMDESMFDYEVDSDEEWEEEEPGESLSCSDGEEEKGEEADDDDDDDGWMVPHGYLSEDEGCNEDDEITPEKLKLQQIAKAKAWEADQKKKLQAVPVITVGCFFEHSPSASMSGDVRLLYEFKAVVLASCIPIPTNLFGCPEPEHAEESVPETAATTPTQKGWQKKAVPDEAMPDLIRLVHGNHCGIKRLIREFRVYWLNKNKPAPSTEEESPTKGILNESVTEGDMDVSYLNESVNDPCGNVEVEAGVNEDGSDKNESEKKKREEGFGCSISKRQLELKITSMAVREKRPDFSKICWYVHENILSQFELSDLKLPNTWEYVSSGPKRSSTPNVCKSKSETPNVSKSKNDTVPAEPTDEDKTEEKTGSVKSTPKDQRSIIDFALSKQELLKKMESQPNKTAVENSPSTPVAVTPDTPKGIKKPNNQRSIMDFASKSSSKKSLQLNGPPQEVIKPVNSITVEVINVDSNSSEVPSSSISSQTMVTSSPDVQSHSCSKATKSNMITDLISKNPPKEKAGIAINATTDVEPMEVDPPMTKGCRQDSSEEVTPGGSVSGDKTSQSECIVID